MLLMMIRASCQIEIQGTPQRDIGVIEGLWHKNIILYFIGSISFKNNKIIWLQHPAWYMKSSHLLLKLMGIDIALGSTGHHGKQGLQKVIEHLQCGYSTMINPDGPSGPPNKLKTGILRMAKQSQRPIQIVHISCSRGIAIPSWDRKIIPLPFSTITVVYHPLLDPNDRSIEDLKQDVSALLAKQ